MGLRYALFWACAALIVAAELLILRAAFVAPPEHAAGIAADAPARTVPRPSRAGEIVWAILPLFALAAALWGAWRSLVPR